MQIIHILIEAYELDVPGYSNMGSVVEQFALNLCREYGQHKLVEGGGAMKTQFLRFIEFEEDTERALDAVQMSFRFFSVHFPRDANEVIEELNHRFREHGVGFQFEDGCIVRVDSEITHQEAVKPVLRLLRGKIYEGAQDEFLKAHENYRHRRYKECVVECLKAFESTMKAICEKRDWNYRKDRDAAKVLVATVLKEGLLPPYLESQLNAVRNLLESGIPTMRSKGGRAHGQGPTRVPTLRHEASYVLNLTATTILMLAESEEALGS